MPLSHQHTPEGSPRPAKRVKIDSCAVTESETTLGAAVGVKQVPVLRPPVELDPTRRPVNYRNGVMLAPMVRSGTLPSRLLALKYGADLVWGPETVDKAIIGCDRIIDEFTGVINYCRSNRPIFSVHPIERRYLIYQIGSSNPELAVQAALKVLPDVAGVDLNCGCPKPFSVHSGMGAALLSNPDLLCSILTALRKALPPDVPVSAKIRLLPDQNDTLDLVRKIVKTGISNLTVHCRTRDMRPREAALVERLRGIVECVEEMGLGVSVIENGDCTGRPDFERVRLATGAHSVMVATSAESNLSCFGSGPVVDAESVLIPEYVRLAKYLGNAFGNSKHCFSQFTSPAAPGGAAARKELRGFLGQTKGYDDFNKHYRESWLDGGKEIFEEIKKGIEARMEKEDRLRALIMETEGTPPSQEHSNETSHEATSLSPAQEVPNEVLPSQEVLTGRSAVAC